MSGGGPSTLACAKALPPTKLKAVAMIVALGPPDIGMSGARLINWIGFPYGLRYCPTFLFRSFWQRDAYGRIDLTDEERLKMLLEQVEKSKSTFSEKDLPIFTDPRFHRLGLKSTREGLAQGFDQVLQDGRLCCLDFGFKIEEIRSDLPVYLWYGKQDVLVPPNHGVQLAARLGSSAHLRLEDETHVSLTVNHKKDILEELMKAM
jgi:pimeloyl-ACP methyl ester carboxylesterase